MAKATLKRADERTRLESRTFETPDGTVLVFKQGRKFNTFIEVEAKEAARRIASYKGHTLKSRDTSGMWRELWNK